MRRLSIVASAFLLAIACGSPSPKPFGEGGETTGGSGATGGGAQTGGTAQGGIAGTGGVVGTGGVSSGGAGGGAAGAAATGGHSSGGHSATGGQTTGGASGGGSATGGSATGGTSTGGAAAGGTSASGGAATGGSGTGGSTGGGGTGPTCASLETDYEAAIQSAKSCTSSGTCAVVKSTTICGCACPGSTYVSDSTAPDNVADKWTKLGCKCPLTLCRICQTNPTSATCDLPILTAAAAVGGGGIIQLPRSCNDH